MAEEDTKKDNDEVEEVETKTRTKKPWVLYGIIGFLVLVLIGGSVVGALYYTGMFDAEKKTDAKGKGEDAEAVFDEEETADAEESDGDTEEGGGKNSAFYVPIDSTFVVNFEGKSRVKFLQVTVEMMTRDETVVESIKTHMPVIRNNLTFLFSSHTYDEVKTIEGKEALRSAALAEVQKIMEEETGKAAIEALYFTSFVTQ